MTKPSAQVLQDVGTQSLRRDGIICLPSKARKEPNGNPGATRHKGRRGECHHFVAPHRRRTRRLSRRPAWRSGTCRSSAIRGRGRSHREIREPWRTMTKRMGEYEVVRSRHAQLSLPALFCKGTAARKPEGINQHKKIFNRHKKLFLLILNNDNRFIALKQWFSYLFYVGLFILFMIHKYII